jgi:hypothetical protein
MKLYLLMIQRMTLSGFLSLLIACDLFSAGPSGAGPAAQQNLPAASQLTFLHNKGADRADEGAIRKILGKDLFYFWRDRESCTAVRAFLPEAEPPRSVILTSASCVAGNPKSRSRTVLTPRFVLADLMRTERLRNAEFLKEYLFDRANDTDISSLVVESVAEPRNDSDAPAVFTNDDKLTALYHDSVGNEAVFPALGIVHRDYFAVMKPVKVRNSDGFAVLLRHNDLAMLPWTPSENRAANESSGLEIRGKPTPKQGDRFYVASVSRDNERRLLSLHLTPVEVVGFSPKDGLIQTCEPPKQSDKDYLSDRGSVLVVRRGDENILLGIASFGSPSVQTVGGQKCVLTTFTHLDSYRGWIKIAYSSVVSKNPVK